MRILLLLLLFLIIKSTLSCKLFNFKKQFPKLGEYLLSTTKFINKLFFNIEV